MTVDVVVCGYAVRHPVAGTQLAYANYVAGLRRLGHRVVYLEESGWTDACYHPSTGFNDDDPSEGMAAMRRMLAELGCTDVPVWYLDRGANRWYRTDRATVRQRLSGADAVINVGGVCLLDEFASADRTALIDMDPGFTQSGHFGASSVGSYDRHFSYGTNLGSDDCLVPDDGVTWLPTVPPVIVDWWQTRGGGPATDYGSSSGGGSASGSATGNDNASARGGSGKLGGGGLDRGPGSAPNDGAGQGVGLRTTTVANIDAYGPTEINGREYGQKRAELDRLGDLPVRLRRELGVEPELAVTGADDTTRRRLADNGWTTVDGQQVSADLGTYRRYIVDSDAEFSVAKEAYVALRTGWFSDRSVCYLAAGRPVVVQDTGLCLARPEGATARGTAADGSTFDGGILTWSTAEEARDALVDVIERYRHHRTLAVELARDRFGHRPVLNRIIEVLS